MLLAINYAQNYASIIGKGLLKGHYADHTGRGQYGPHELKELEGTLIMQTT